MDYILEVIELEKEFKEFLKKKKVLKWVNLKIKKWEIYGFLGPNGAWKTTTLKCVLGFLKPTKGEIKIFWEKMERKFDIYKRIWYAPENAYYYDHLKWLEFLVFMGQLAGIPKQDAEIIWLGLLRKLGLDYAAWRYIKTYSKWMKQRLWLAASLINDPEIIFWDEPMSGLDPLGRVLVKELMKELKDKWKTIFFNTHILSDVEEVADRFGIIFDWKIIYEDTPRNLTKPLEEFFKEIIQKQEWKLEIR